MSSEQRLDAVLQALDVETIGLPEDCTASRVVEDSRCVRPGDVFFARGGNAFDGRHFIRQAEEAGACAVLSDAAGASLATGPAIVSDDPAVTAGLLAHRLAGRPSEKMGVIGVTGTNGKTTVTTLLQQVLTGDRPCGLLGGIARSNGRTQSAAVLTTPMSCDVAAWLSDCRSSGCDHAAMEVSSHAIDQKRVAGVRFACAVFTNLSGDHLDHHGTMDAYFDCKRQLFRGLDQSAIAVTNLDDPRGRGIVSGIDASVVTCSLLGDADVRGRVVELGSDGISMEVCSPWGTWTQRMSLIGRFNAMNGLQTIAAACVTGVGIEQVRARLATAEGAAGRMQVVATSPRVIVDFAHTDGALQAVLEASREAAPEDGRLIVVVGCGGDRDATKRPRMAAVACNHSDGVWLTSDNPRSEDPQRILRDMEAGVPTPCAASVHVEVDREAAIRAAIGSASARDCVVIAGKGHERTQLVAGGSIEFDDVDVARRVMSEREGGQR